MSDGNSPDSGETSKVRPIRYYTLSYSFSQGRQVVRPDGIIINGQEIHDQIRRATQAFLARQSSSTNATIAASSKTTTRRGATIAATPTTDIIHSPLLGCSRYLNHRNSKSEIMSVERRDLPPRSQPVAVSLPVNMNMRRYINNHRRAKGTKSFSSSTSSTCLPSSRRTCSGGGGGCVNSHDIGFTQNHSSSPDDHGIIFTMDEDVEMECAGDMVESPLMTRSFASVTSCESEEMML